MQSGLMGNRKPPSRPIAAIVSVFHPPEASFCFPLLPLTVFSAHSWFLILQHVASHMIIVHFLLSSLLQPQHEVTCQNSKPSPHVHHYEDSLLFILLMIILLTQLCLLIGLVRSAIAGGREGIRCFRSYRQGKLYEKEKSGKPGKI